MAAIPTDDVPFEVSVVGEETKEKWFGKFRALRRLSHRAQMQRSRIRREMLGEHPQYATQRDIEMAIMFSDLAVSITQAPKWWAESGGGQDLVDDNVIVEVYNKAQAIQNEVLDEEKKKTLEDAKVLKKAVENPEEPTKEEDDD